MPLTPEQLELRRNGLGSSDIAAVAGLNPYRTALDVFQEKQGLVPGFQGNEFTYWGTALEPVVANRYAKESELELDECGTLVHPDYSFAMATPDRLVYGKPRYLLEVKTSGRRLDKDWGEPGSDHVPAHYLAQCQWQMLVAGAFWGFEIPKVDLACLFGGNRYEVFHIARDEALQHNLLAIGRDFWQQHVQENVPPVVDGSKRATQWLSEHWSSHNDKIIEAPQEAIVWAEQLKAARGQEEVAKAARREAENHIKALIKDNEGISGQWGRATWKKSADGTKVNWEEAALEAGASPDVIAKHTAIKPGSRRFLVRFDGK